jgi:hypothetical protein
MFTSYDAPTEPYTSGTREGDHRYKSNGRSTPYAADGRQSAKKARRGPVHFDRLFQAMRHSRRMLGRYRQERAHAVKLFVGRHYSDGGAYNRIPVNLLARYVQVMARSLVPKTPRIMLTTRHRDREPAVSAMQEWLNQRLVESHFAQTLQRWVIDALFSVGIMKVALGTPADAAVSGYTSPAGVPFAETVDLDDFAFDSGARDMRQCGWFAHRFRVPLAVAEAVDYYDSKAKKHLAAAATGHGDYFNQEGDERVEVIGRGYESGEEKDYEPMVDLWEVYLPREKRVLTFSSDAGGVPSHDVPLRDAEWVGPPCGPYHFLSLLPVPGNAMPSAPVQHLVDLQEAVNSGYRKLIVQMERQKTNLPVRGGAVDDARRLIQANDGEAFPCENADMLKEVRWGGPDPVNANFVIHLSDIFNKMGGNLDLLSGSNPQSKTATQDKILAANAGAGVADMQEHTVVGISNVADALCWFWWYHPQEVMETTRSLPGAEDIAVTRRLYPAGKLTPQGDKPGLAREGRYEGLHLRVDPYSLVYRTPQERLAFLSQLVTQMQPLLPMLAQQGVQFDAQAYLKKVAEYSDEPDVTTLFTVAEPTPQAEGAGGMDSRMPTQTSREYVRRSVGQDTEANRAAEFENMNSEMGSDMGAE